MKRLLIIFVLLVFISSAYAIAPPAFQTSSTTLQIESPHVPIVKQGISHRFHVHVINQTMAKTNLTTSCVFHLYNSTGWDTDMTKNFMEFETYNGLDFAYTVDGGNFTNTGIYNYVVQCNSTSEVGFYENIFEVTPTGIEPTLQRSLSNMFAILSMFIVSIMFFLAFMTVEHKPIKYSVAIMSSIFFLIGINLIFNLLVNEIVDTSIINLFEAISAGSYYFFWLGGGIICILLFLTGLTLVKDAIGNRKIDKYGGTE